jgi:hypothetical protein
MYEMSIRDNVLIKSTWQDELLANLSNLIHGGPLNVAFGNTLESGCGIHLAVLVEPYLTLILEGKKTIESRFSLTRQAPFGRVFQDDILILKRSSGPIEGMCRVADAWFYRLQPDSWKEIDRLAKALCMDDSPFWQSKRKSTYATLIRVSGVVRLPPFYVSKLDPRGWVTVRRRNQGAEGGLF